MTTLLGDNNTQKEKKYAYYDMLKRKRKWKH